MWEIAKLREEFGGNVSGRREEMVLEEWKWFMYARGRGKEGGAVA